MPLPRPTAILQTREGPLHIADVRAAAGERFDALPWSLRVLMENVLRTCTMRAALALHSAQEVSLIRAGGVMPFMLERALYQSSFPAARIST